MKKLQEVEAQYHAKVPKLEYDPLDYDDDDTIY